MSTSKITVVREWWQVETKDGEAGYRPHPTKHNSLKDALKFVRFLALPFRKNAVIAHHIETKEILE